MSRNCIFSRRSFSSGSAENREKDGKNFSSFSRILAQKFALCEDYEAREVRPGDTRLAGIFVCWVDGLVSGAGISEDVIRPLTEDERFSRVGSAAECFALIERGGVYSYSVKRRASAEEAAAELTRGSCAIVFDSLSLALTFEVKSSAVRSIGVPTIEKTVKGAKDAFVETLRTNTALVRRRLHDPDLKLRQLTVGQRTRTQVAIMYMQSIACAQTVDEVVSRISSLDIDGLTAAGSLEQYIVDSPRSPFPQLLHTERPDRFASELLSGRIGIIADGLPLGFIAPADLAQLMKVTEDSAQHYLTSSLLILLRWTSAVLAILLPAVFVAIAMYHQEMLPFKLITSMIDAKQQVPFSVAIEVLSMLVAFELLQEAGIRLPSPVGDTVSIIGALIVGQSAVEARVVSPVAVIVVATAGICGYAQPSQDLGYALRMVRLMMVGLAIALGMYGIMLALALLIWHLCSIESFGVSYMAPMSEEGFKGALGALIQPPLWHEKDRPARLRPRDTRRQK
jgi:spore germination protein KA